jgi:hypothetical protein
MIQIKFSEEDIILFKQERYRCPQPHVMRKMEVLYLKSLGLSHSLICQIAGVSPNTMRSYFTEYIEGGIEKIKEVNFYRPQTELSAYASSISSYLRDHPPA